MAERDDPSDDEAGEPRATGRGQAQNGTDGDEAETGTDGDEAAAGTDGDVAEAGTDGDEVGSDRPADAPPEAVVDEAERLTRLARDAVDDAEAAAYREARDDALAEHGYRARVREEDDGAVLVCHPAAWIEDGVVRPERVEDLDRGIERRVAGAGSEADWAEVEAHNRDIAGRVEASHGEVHGANAHALADFMSNHYAKRVEDATRDELEEFLAEYYPRNAFPSDREAARIEASVALVYEAAGAESPLDR